ncbi:MAG: hypothetical protein ACXWYI_12735 [Actinomycetota bacterium]
MAGNVVPSRHPDRAHAVMPLFAMTVILIDAFVIYGLVAYGMDME